MTIRRALSQDAPYVADIIAQAFGENPPNPAHIASVIQQHNDVWVAEGDGEAVGFVSCFQTLGKAGQLRWEVDLLAVAPKARGQQLATQLIKTCLQNVPSNAMPRAFIRIDNIASQISFERAGFWQTDMTCNLLVWEPTINEKTPPKTEAHCVSVETLSYRGIWLENLGDLDANAQQKSITHARHIAAQESRDTVGAMLDERVSLPDIGQTLIGQYQLWTTS